MNRHPDLRGAAATFRKDHPAVDTAAVITLAADPTQYHVLDWVMCSYDIGTIADTLTIAVGGTNVFVVNITSTGEKVFDFEDAPIYTDKNESLVVTLSAGPAGTTGKVNARTR